MTRPPHCVLRSEPSLRHTARDSAADARGLLRRRAGRAEARARAGNGFCGNGLPQVGKQQAARVVDVGKLRRQRKRTLAPHLRFGKTLQAKQQRGQVVARCRIAPASARLSECRVMGPESTGDVPDDSGRGGVNAIHVHPQLPAPHP